MKKKTNKIKFKKAFKELNELRDSQETKFTSQSKIWTDNSSPDIILKDTAEYNYNLGCDIGYLSAIKDFEKILNKEIKLNYNYDRETLLFIIDDLKKQLEKLKWCQIL